MVFDLVHFGFDLLGGETVHQLDGFAGQGHVLFGSLGFADMYLPPF